MSLGFPLLDSDFVKDNFQYFVTLAWIIGIFLISRYARHTLRANEKLDVDRKRQRINAVDNMFNLVMVLGLILIWATELQNIAISIAAFMVSLIIATKEFISCIVGAFYKGSTRPYQVGDWVRIGPFEGEVTDSD
ncbi:MAG: mechanosensitive ion channel family protein, partial [Gammaproteobacteria bacterium]